MVVIYISFQTSCSGTLYSVYDDNGMDFKDWEGFASCIERLHDTIFYAMRGQDGQLPDSKISEQEIWSKCAGKKAIVLRIPRWPWGSLWGSAYLARGRVRFDGIDSLVGILRAENKKTP